MTRIGSRVTGLVLLALGACSGGSALEPGPVPGCERLPASVLELPPPVHHLVARRAAVAAGLAGDVVVLVKSGADSANPRDDGYRGDANFLYLTGLDLPEAWLALHVHDGALDSAVLYLPDPATSPSYPVVAHAAAAARGSRCLATLDADVRRRVAQGTGLAVGSTPAWSDTMVASLRAGGLQLTSLPTHPSRLRRVKDTAEIARIRIAAQITAESIVAAVPMIRAGSNEGDVADAILGRALERGATRALFPSIIASGSNALTLHYTANDRTLVGDELVVMDVGAEYGEYGADVTRTYPVSGRFTARQRALYELVLGAQQAALEAAGRPHMDEWQLESLTRAWLRDHSNGLCGERNCEEYFVHSLAHGIGLNVHEAAPVPFVPGAVIAIEPGIYLPEEGIGIRIEDTVLVTETGIEVLSAAAPKTVSEIEALFGREG